MHRWDRFSSVHFFARLGPVLNGALLCKVVSAYFQQKMEKISKKKREEKMIKIVKADITDIPELYQLQLLSFESEAEMIGSREVPALMETKEENALDFSN